MVYPKKDDQDHKHLGGTKVISPGKLFDLMQKIYIDADHECTIDIAFKSDNSTQQKNEFRNDLISYVNKPSISKGRKLATRLELVTTGRSGPGLLFLISGKNGRNKKIVISRFPADVGILAEEKGTSLTVEFLERVFMKNSHKYKSVVFEHPSTQAGFWSGKAIDKQIGSADSQISDYWVFDFLLADFNTTPAAGTRRAALALREAIKATDDLSVRRELSAVTSLLDGLAGKSVSIADIASKYSLSDDAIETIISVLPNDVSYKEKFKFDVAEYGAHIKFRTVDLDNGATVSADVANFDEVFTFKEAAEGAVEISTVGRVTDAKVTKRK